MKQATIKKEELRVLESMNFKRRSDSVVGGRFRMHLCRTKDDIALYKIGEGLGWQVFSVSDNGKTTEIDSPYKKGFPEGSGMNFSELKELLVEIL